MDFLQEMITILQVFRERKVIENGKEPRISKYEQLFHAIKSGNIKTDRAALEFLYPDTLNQNTYLKLKSRFRQKLIDQVFLLDYPLQQYSDFQRAYFLTYKNWAAVRILFAKGMKEAGAYLGKKTLQNALRFEFSNLVIDLCRLLRIYAAASLGDQKQVAGYNKKIALYLEIEKAEIEAEQYYSEIMMHFALSKSKKSALVPVITKYSEALMQYDSSYETFNFLFFAYSIHANKCELSNDHAALIQYCDQVIRKMEAKPYELKNQIGGFLIRKITAQLKLGRLDDIEATSRYCREKITVSTLNWFKFYQAYFTYLVYQRRYADIPKHIYSVFQNKKLKYQNTHIKETWRLIRAYIQLMIEIGRIPATDAHPLPGFRVGKFMNNIPEFSKDKRGYNIDVLVVQLLLAFSRKNYDLFIDRMDTLKTYSSRYLKKDATFRSNCFIQILLQLPRSDFFKGRFLIHSKKYRKKLTEVSLIEANQIAEFELVPYEQLLEWVVGMCEGE